MRVTIASGKGGTGKTTIAMCLAKALAEQGRPTTYVDADVEEPNGHLFLSPRDVQEEVVTVKVPALARESCSGCGKCQEICSFGAILALPSSVVVLDQLCHSCGACLLACRERALVEVERRVGVIRSGWSGDLEVRWGVVDVGEPRAVPVIEQLLKGLDHRDGGPERTYVIDAAPGSSCLPMAAVSPSDAVVLVTEPTPLGLHDVRLALRMARALDVPAMVILNKSDLGDDAVATFLKGKGVPIVARIPFDSALARAYAEGELLSSELPLLDGAVQRLTSELSALSKEVSP